MKLIFILFPACFLLFKYFSPSKRSIAEERSLKKAHKVYKEVKFETVPFLKKSEIQEFADFLLRHTEELKNFNRHKEGRQVSISDDGIRFNYTNSGDCFNLLTFKETFIEEYIPANLIDSLFLFSEGVRGDLIDGCLICSKNCIENIDTTQGSIVFGLNYKKQQGQDESYYLNHRIIQNRKFLPNKRVKKLGEDLSKDTTLVKNLKYTITIKPYMGSDYY